MSETKTVGKFTYDEESGTISGPGDYMREAFPARFASIEAGTDVVAQKGFELNGGDAVLAILVSLQTDYAGFAGYKSMFGVTPKGAHL
jgi:hypothetical protein